MGCLSLEKSGHAAIVEHTFVLSQMQSGGEMQNNNKTKAFVSQLLQQWRP
jgi:hypothetical protein